MIVFYCSTTVVLWTLSSSCGGDVGHVVGRDVSDCHSHWCWQHPLLGLQGFRVVGESGRLDDRVGGIIPCTQVKPVISSIDI